MNNQQSYNTAGSFGQGIQSQWRTSQKSYEPSGFVQSVYDPNQQQQQQQQSNYPSTQSYHTANYQGTQQGHDQNLRADSTKPSNIQFGNQQNQQNQFQGLSQFQNQNQFQNVNQNQNYPSAQSYHTASYKGYQQGHDQNLRADSIQPSQLQYGQTSQYGQSQFSQPYGQSQFNQPWQSGQSSQFGISSNQNQPSQFGQSQWGNTGSQSYQTSNYQGNLQGHDQYLRGDSSQPSQSQFSFSSYGQK